jgi:hypothetical protein
MQILAVLQKNGPFSAFDNITGIPVSYSYTLFSQGVSISGYTISKYLAKVTVSQYTMYGISKGFTIS